MGLFSVGAVATWNGDAIGPSAAARGPGPSQTLHRCARGCSGARVWGCKGSRSCSGSPVTSPEQQIHPQTQTMLEQTGTAGNNQVVTASSSRGGSGRPPPRSPARLQSPVWAEPALRALPEAAGSTPACMLSPRPGCSTVPSTAVDSPCSYLGKRRWSPALGPRGAQWGREPGSERRLEAQRAYINAGRNMLLCASGFVMEHV